MCVCVFQHVACTCCSDMCQFGEWKTLLNDKNKQKENTEFVCVCVIDSDTSSFLSRGSVLLQ